MPLTMGVVPLVRLVVLGTATFFSLIVFAISANVISQANQYIDVPLTRTSLALAVGIISFLTLPVLLVVDIFCRGAFTSRIVVELSWLTVLTVLWVATAGSIVDGFNLIFPLGCDLNSYPIINAFCHQTEAAEAFSWLNFIILLFYICFLGIMSIIATVRGNSGIWFSSVKESFGPQVGPTQHAMTNVSSPPVQAGFPVQPQHTGVPTQSPHVTGQGIIV